MSFYQRLKTDYKKAAKIFIQMAQMFPDKETFMTGNETHTCCFILWKFGNASSNHWQFRLPDFSREASSHSHITNNDFNDLWYFIILTPLQPSSIKQKSVTQIQSVTMITTNITEMLCWLPRLCRTLRTSILPSV